MQDAFLRLCQADRAKVDGHLAAWLYTVCRNRAYDVRRKEGDGWTRSLKAAPRCGQAVTRAGRRGGTAQALAKVFDVLGELPEETQEAFRLKFGTS